MREQGYYWVKLPGWDCWFIAEFMDRRWFICNPPDEYYRFLDYGDDDFVDIDERRIVRGE